MSSYRTTDKMSVVQQVNFYLPLAYTIEIPLARREDCSIWY